MITLEIEVEVKEEDDEDIFVGPSTTKKEPINWLMMSL